MAGDDSSGPDASPDPQLSLREELDRAYRLILALLLEPEDTSSGQNDVTQAKADSALTEQELHEFFEPETVPDSWTPLKLKIEEAAFFARQLNAYERHPRHFMFYLSAFLSSARSVTFHVQAQFGGTGRAQYERLTQEMLRDEISIYFRNLRNQAEKRGYPPVSVSQICAHRGADGGLSWTQTASMTLFAEDRDDSYTESLEQLLQQDWVVHRFASFPVAIRYHWTFNDFPGGPRPVADACDKFAERLWEFLFRFRTLWEEENAPALVKRRTERRQRLYDLIDRYRPRES